MARKRDLRPGFFKNEYLAALPFETRLLFAGLWTLADKAGRLEDRPGKIKMEIFPADWVDVNEMLDQLAAGSDPFISRYEVDGRHFLQILGWQRNQKPHPSEEESVIPPCTESARIKKVSTVEHLGTPPGSETSTTVDASYSFPSSPSLSSCTSLALACNSDANASVSPSGDESAFVAAWNGTAGVMPIRKMTSKRRSALRTRLRTSGWWQDFLEAVKQFPLPFVEEGRSNGWVPDAEWILKPDSVAKILEGKYHTRNRGDPRGTMAAVEARLAKVRSQESQA